MKKFRILAIGLAASLGVMVASNAMAHGRSPSVSISIGVPAHGYLYDIAPYGYGYSQPYVYYPTYVSYPYYSSSRYYRGDRYHSRSHRPDTYWRGDRGRGWGPDGRNHRGPRSHR